MALVKLILLKDQIQNKLGLKHVQNSGYAILKFLKDQIQNKLGLKPYKWQISL